MKNFLIGVAIGYVLMHFPWTWMIVVIVILIGFLAGFHRGAR